MSSPGSSEIQPGVGADDAFRDDRDAVKLKHLRAAIQHVIQAVRFHQDAAQLDAVTPKAANEMTAGRAVPARGHVMTEHALGARAKSSDARWSFPWIKGLATQGARR